MGILPLRAGIPGGMQIIFWRLSVGQATWSPDPRLLAANPAGSFGISRDNS